MAPWFTGMESNSPDHSAWTSALPNQSMKSWESSSWSVPLTMPTCSTTNGTPTSGSTTPTSKPKASSLPGMPEDACCA